MEGLKIIKGTGNVLFSRGIKNKATWNESD